MADFVQDIDAISDESFELNKLYLGDRLEVMARIPSGIVDFIFTSPPYNVGIQYKNHHDLMDYPEYLRFLDDTWRESMRVLKTGGRIAVNITSMTWQGEWQPLYNDVINQLRALGFIMRCDIMWYKNTMSKRTAWGSYGSPSNPYVIQPYEFIWVFSKGAKKHDGARENIDITKEEFVKFSNSFWNIKAETGLKGRHPAPFPKELVYRLLKFYTYKHDVVLDMFGGSGTTALVAKENDRDFIYIDNCEEYLNFAKQRIFSREKLL